jgi:hypothetical protein
LSDQWIMAALRETWPGSPPDPAVAGAQFPDHPSRLTTSTAARKGTLMVSLEELDRRLAAVEERLGLEAGLRASQDRDLASLKTEWRSANNLLQALALTQSDQTRMLTGLEATAADHGERLGRIDEGMRQIIGLLDHLIERDRPSQADADG